ncbi:hypothetical protein QQ045_025339 [Rhodiola kirilowii]
MKRGAAEDGRRLMMHDAESMARIRRHQNLLQEYFDLEKELEMKKIRYESLKQQRAILMAEVRFLRRRHQLLLKIQAANQKLDDYHRPQSSNIIQVQESSQVQASEPHFGKTYLTTDLHPILAGVLKEGGSLQPLPASSLTPSKKGKTCSINEKGMMMKKKKISWQDQEPVKV